MNGTAIAKKYLLQNSFKIKDNNVYDHHIIEISLKDLHLTSWSLFPVFSCCFSVAVIKKWRSYENVCVRDTKIQSQKSGKQEVDVWPWRKSHTRYKSSCWSWMQIFKSFPWTISINGMYVYVYVQRVNLISTTFKRRGIKW